LPTHSAFTVFGSDFHQKALQQAQRGKYELNELDLVPPLYRYWLMKQDDSLVIANRLQQHLQYFSLNLVQPPPSLPIQPGQCQLIVCQNVLIYFRQFVQRDVIKYLTQFLAEDGVLILGSGEILRLNQRELVRLRTHQVDAYVKQNAPSWLMTLSE
jgi:chemotaxis methyl-accepting protein methylase